MSLDETATGALLADPLEFLETQRHTLIAVVDQALALGMTRLGPSWPAC
ncbi:hypothetical protein [Labedaea rhizosphaerae]|nr:hypothetical protein [Labedaea rhizosphaerae]